MRVCVLRITDISVSSRPIDMASLIHWSETGNKMEITEHETFDRYFINSNDYARNQRSLYAHGHTEKPAEDHLRLNEVHDAQNEDSETVKVKRHRFTK